MNLSIIKTVYKKMSFVKQENKQTGFTLLEILIAIGLFTILISISFVSYRVITKDLALKTLKQVSALFPITLNNCITSSGWKVTRPDGTDVYPCTDTNSAEAFSKISYTCPEDTSPADNTCNFLNNDTDGYVCLNAQKKIRGKTYEIHVIVNRNNRNDYKILCAENVTTPESLSTSICTGSTSSSYSECDW